MDQVVKKEWVKGLRSRKYKQTTGVLKDHLGYCCLGVLCNIIDPENWDQFDNYKYKSKSSEVEIPDNLRKKLKITKKQQEKLVELNDDQGLSFNKIADYIEENL